MAADDAADGRVVVEASDDAVAGEGVASYCGGGDDDVDGDQYGVAVGVDVTGEAAEEVGDGDVGCLYAEGDGEFAVGGDDAVGDGDLAVVAVGGGAC